MLQRPGPGGLQEVRDALRRHHEHPRVLRDLLPPRARFEDQDPEGCRGVVRESAERGRARHQGADRRVQRQAGGEVRGRTLQAAQAPGRRRTHPADQADEERVGGPAHRHREGQAVDGTARRPEAHGPARSGQPHLPRLVRAGDDLGGRQARDQAHALRLPAGRPASPRFTTSSTRAPTTPAATTCRASGRASSATRTGSSWSMRSTRT